MHVRYRDVMGGIERFFFGRRLQQPRFGCKINCICVCFSLGSLRWEYRVKMMVCKEQERDQTLINDWVPSFCPSSPPSAYSSNSYYDAMHKRSRNFLLICPYSFAHTSICIIFMSGKLKRIPWRILEKNGDAGYSMLQKMRCNMNKHSPNSLAIELIYYSTVQPDVWIADAHKWNSQFVVWISITVSQTISYGCSLIHKGDFQYYKWVIVHREMQRSMLNG